MPFLKIFSLSTVRSVFWIAGPAFQISSRKTKMCIRDSIDIEQCNGIVRSTHTDVLRERTIDINLASYRNAAANETAVYIARRCV